MRKPCQDHHQPLATVENRQLLSTSTRVRVLATCRIPATLNVVLVSIWRSRARVTDASVVMYYILYLICIENKHLNYGASKAQNGQRVNPSIDVSGTGMRIAVNKGLHG